MPASDSMKKRFEDEPHPFGEGFKPIEIIVLEQVIDCDVLDLGSGDGRVAIELARQRNRVTAIDDLGVALATLEQSAREQGLTDIITGKIDFDQNAGLEDFLNEQGTIYDVVTILNVMHMLPRESALNLLASAGKHIKDNGEVVMRGALPRPPMYENGASNMGSLTKSELIEALANAGLVLEAFHEFEWTPSVKLPSPQPAFFAIAHRSPHLRSSDLLTADF